MSWQTRLTRSLGLSLLLMLIVGCGKDGNKVTVHPVKGTVTYKGKPLKGGGAIIFFPKSGSGKEASGTIAEDGSFTLMTYKEGDGAAAGEYRVVIHQTTAKEPDISSDEKQTPGKPIETVPKEDRIPRIYADSTQSPILKTVTDSENTIKIELKPIRAGSNNSGV